MEFWGRIAPAVAPGIHNYREFVEDGTRIVATPWPFFGAWSADPGGTWRPVEVPFTVQTIPESKSSPQLAFFGYRGEQDDRQRSALEKARWIETVPETVRIEAGRFGRHAASVVRFACTYGSPAQDLLLTGGHTFVFGLMRNAGMGRLGFQNIQILIRSRRREIARALGFPPTKSCVKFLTAASPDVLVGEQRGPLATVTGYEMLAGIAINPDAREVASHLPRLTTELIRILAFPPLLRRVMPSLLHELAAFEQPFDTAQELADLVRLELLLNVPSPRGPFHSVRALHEEHNRLAALHRRVLQGHSPARLTEPFPQPPLPGNAGIIPLTTPMDLLQEGDECHNCVGSYIDSVRCGDCYIYRVLKPGRATLSIVRSGGLWVISELKAPCNRHPSPRIRDAVNSWLRLSRSQPGVDSTVYLYNVRTPARRPRITVEEADRRIQQYCESARKHRHYDYRYDRR